MPTEEEQGAIDKCINQLEDRASWNTVMRAKRIVLQYICCDYCHMTLDQLDGLCTKDGLYRAAAT